MKDRIWRNEHIYAAFDRIIRLFEKRVEGKIPVINGFHKEVLEQRIVQRFVQLLYYPFCILAKQRLKAGGNPLPGKDETMLLNRVTISAATGKISPNITFIFILFADFFWEWLQAIAGICKGYFNQSRKWTKPVTLIFGISDGDIHSLGTEKSFLKFCKQGPIQPLVDADTLVIQSAAKSKTGDVFLQYAKHPIYKTLVKTKLGFLNRTVLLLGHLFLPFRFGWMVMQNRLSVVLTKDIVQFPVVACLDKMGMIRSVIITNSLFFQQYLWMRQPENRSFKVHELHYSQNTIPFVYKDDPFVDHFPAFRHVCVDEHWVWTSGYQKYLEQLGHKGPIHVVGPILWYLTDEAEKNVRPANEITVVVFDITPVTADMEDKLGIIHYYYHTELMIRFIDGIIDVCKTYGKKHGKIIRIWIKTKRLSKAGFHNPAYEAYIKKCEDENDFLEVIDISQNLFSLLKSTDVSVSIPYTSVPYIAAHEKKPAVYFDPDGELLFTNEPSGYIKTASGKDRLTEVFETILSSTNY